AREYEWATRGPRRLRVLRCDQLLTVIAGAGDDALVVVSDTYLMRLDSAERIALWIRAERAIGSGEAVRAQRVAAARSPLLAAAAALMPAPAGALRAAAHVARPWGEVVDIAFPAQRALQAADARAGADNDARALAL